MAFVLLSSHEKLGEHLFTIIIALQPSSKNLGLHPIDLTIHLFFYKDNITKT